MSLAIDPKQNYSDQSLSVVLYAGEAELKASAVNLSSTLGHNTFLANLSNFFFVLYSQRHSHDFHFGFGYSKPHLQNDSHVDGVASRIGDVDCVVFASLTRLAR
jgi:hypothetical protein